MTTFSSASDYARYVASHRRRATLVCASCGRTFEALAHYGGRRRFCSVACRQRDFRARQKTQKKDGTNFSSSLPYGE